jgi:hypothetical protein
MRGETGVQPHGQLTYTLVTTSVGNVTASVLRKEYGHGHGPAVLTVQVGFYAASQEQYEHPAVPASSINSGAPGQAWIHAYTVFGRLKLTGGYNTYKSSCIAQYYDEVVRLLVQVGSDAGVSVGLTVGDVFTL